MVKKENENGVYFFRYSNPLEKKSCFTDIRHEESEPSSDLHFRSIKNELAMASITPCHLLIISTSKSLEEQKTDTLIQEKQRSVGAQNDLMTISTPTRKESSQPTVKGKLTHQSPSNVLNELLSRSKRGTRPPRGYPRSTPPAGRPCPCSSPSQPWQPPRRPTP